MATIKKSVAKKTLVKAQNGKIVGEEYKRKTPFQDYLKNNKGAQASDTIAKPVAGKPMSYFSSANPKNEKALFKAVDKSYNKKQSGGPADAMRKAMGQKPTSTKETLKYVRKNGSGYIPPVKSDTTGRKSASDTIRKKPAMLDSAEDAIMRNLGIKKSNKKDGAAMKTDFDKLGYKKGGAVKKKMGGATKKKC
jgi:hypothetical protein